MNSKRIELKWIDSSYSEGWVDLKDIEVDPAALKDCHTIGFELRRTKDFLTVALTMSADPDEACGVMSIPIRCITWQRYLK